uniref:Thioredoxin domain-containing protein n=1 Tax=Timema bartmani TaxID=61472 RepID=A0A7R9EN55_9NEOP|nr:unnamed protein product [Timema bartmani]
MKNILIILLISVVSVVLSAPLEVVNDDELVNLFKNEKNVIVLFTKKDCEQCDNYENELIHLREDLVDSLNAWVVKAVNSQLVRLYNPTKEPALVFFRHGIPLLYDGPLNDELILHTFIENKEPVVRELSDDNFEHLTQASSGATTGDWFIMLRSGVRAEEKWRRGGGSLSGCRASNVLNYSTDCVDCQRLQARWEAVGAKLKSRLNVARINRQTSGAVTARRLEIRDVPTFVLLRQGKLYRYNIPKYDVGSFAAFATDWYKNARAEPIPVPKSPLRRLNEAAKQLTSKQRHVNNGRPVINKSVRACSGASD